MPIAPSCETAAASPTPRDTDPGCRNIDEREQAESLALAMQANGAAARQAHLLALRERLAREGLAIDEGV